MRSAIIGLLTLVVATGCGGSAPSGDDGGPSTVDSGADAGAEASAEASVDAGAEAGADASADGSLDAGSEASADAGIDGSEAAAGTVSVLTQHNDVARTGANLQETTLTTSNVTVGQFGLLRCLPVDDQVYAQPLIVSRLSVAGGVKDVLYVATVNDTVYAFDADASPASAPIWQASLLGAGEAPPANTDMVGACGGAYQDYSGNIGIVGTPVIDPASQTMYLVARSKANGNYFERLHAIDVVTGAERANSPVTIAASIPGTGDGTTTVAFDPLHENQRTGLLLDNGVVYMTWSGHCDWPPYHGWVMGYDASSLAQRIVYNDTPNGGEGGIWMGGGGPAADSQGNIYVATANGSVGSTGDATDLTNRAESFLKLVPQPPSFEIASWFTPWNFGQADDDDADFGITGVLLVPNTTLAVSGNKSGEIFITDRDSMGGLNPLPVVNASVQTLELPVLANQGVVGFFGGPTFWDSPDGPLLYVWGSGSNLAAYRLDPGTGQFLDVPFATGATLTAAPVQAVMLSLSANGNASGSGILWATHALGGNPNQQVLPGILRAFDAEDVGTELWNSNQNPSHDAFGSFAKFGYPTIANGHVYVPTFSNQVCIYGLLETEPPPATPSAPADLVATATSNTAVSVSWNDTSGGTASFVLERAAASGPFAAIGGTLPPGQTTFADSGLAPYGTYEYRARAVLANVLSDYSNTAQVVVNAGPAAPALGVSGNSVPIAPGSATPIPQNFTDFGAVITGSTASSTFVVLNRGLAALAISGVTITGASAGQFTLAHVPASTLAGGTSDTLVVTFAPPAFGEASATITIASNDPTTPSYSFAIRGAAIGTLVGWWKLDDGAGNVALDSSGYEDVGALGGGATFVASGPLDGALLFSGLSSVEVPPVAVLDPAPAITVAAWIYPTTAFTAAANPRVVQKGESDDQYRLLVESGSLKFDLATLGTAATTTLPSAGTWTHVAGTYDGAEITLWVNGVAVAETPASGLIPTTNDSLFIGAKQGSTFESNSFQGAIDDVRIYSVALTAAQIGAIVLEGTGDGGALDAGALDGSAPPPASFSADVQPIFDGACTTCHQSPGPAGGLDLGAGHAYADLVNVASTEQPAFERVVPGDAADSYLYAKVAGGTSAITISGAVMPQGGTALSEGKLALLLSWIAGGAPNN